MSEGLPDPRRRRRPLEIARPDDPLSAIRRRVQLAEMMLDEIDSYMEIAEDAEESALRYAKHGDAWKAYDELADHRYAMEHVGVRVCAWLAAIAGLP